MSPFLRNVYIFFLSIYGMAENFEGEIEKLKKLEDDREKLILDTAKQKDQIILQAKIDSEKELEKLQSRIVKKKNEELKKIEEKINSEADLILKEAEEMASKVTVNEKEGARILDETLRELGENYV